MTFKDYITEALTVDVDAPQYMRAYLEANGIKVNKDNTVTLYHASPPEQALKIKKEGFFKGGGGPVGGMTGVIIKNAAFFGFNKKWVSRTWGGQYKTVLTVKVPVEYIRHGAENFNEAYFEGGLKRMSDGTWKPKKLQSTFVDEIAKMLYGKKSK